VPKRHECRAPLREKFTHCAWNSRAPALIVIALKFVLFKKLKNLCAETSTGKLARPVLNKNRRCGATNQNLLEAICDEHKKPNISAPTSPGPAGRAYPTAASN